MDHDLEPVSDFCQVAPAYQSKRVNTLAICLTNLNGLGH